MLPAFFWAEYLAEKRSCSTNIIDYTEYCEDFSSCNWRAYKFDFYTGTEGNFFYLCKALSYFMGRTTNLDMRRKFCAKMENPLLKDFVDSLEKELFVLEDQLPFDDVEKLSILSHIMNEYRSKFHQTFAPRKNCRLDSTTGRFDAYYGCEGRETKGAKISYGKLRFILLGILPSNHSVNSSRVSFSSRQAPRFCTASYCHCLNFSFLRLPVFTLAKYRL